MSTIARMSIVRLFTSHLDAWCVTLIAATIPLMIHDRVTAATIYLALAITAGAWLAFAINDYFDASRDRHDAVKARRNYFVVNPMPPWRALVLFVAICSVLAPAFLQFGRRGVIVALIGCLAMWAYSAEPLRLKSRPVLDLIAHALFVETFPYWAVLFMLGVSWTALDRIFLLVALLSSFTAQLEQQARDYKVDRLTDTTFTTRFGLPVNLVLMRLATAGVILTVVINVLNGNIPGIYVPLALIALPMLLLRFVRGRWQPRSQRLSYVLSLLAAGYLLMLLVLPVEF